MTSSSSLKNLNIYWFIGTTLGIWLLFIHSPPILRDRKVLYWDSAEHTLQTNDLLFLLHLVGVYTIYIVCMFNTLFTPSTTTTFLWSNAIRFRTMHIIMGRIGMVAGYIGFIIGSYLAWWRVTESMGFSVGITLGGIIQVYLQIRGHAAIRRYQRLKAETNALMGLQETKERYQSSVLEVEMKDALQEHITCMVALFLLACGIPAAVRVSDALAQDNDVMNSLVLIAIITGLNVIHGPMSRTYNGIGDSNCVRVRWASMFCGGGEAARMSNMEQPPSCGDEEYTPSRVISLEAPSNENQSLLSH